MKLIKPSIEWLWNTPYPLQTIENACYKSEDKTTNDSAQKFVKMLMTKGHEAMLEHASISYRVICDRGVTHEIVRHRLFSYAQESTRYCNYKGGVTFIIPPWFDVEEGEYHRKGQFTMDTPLDTWLYLMCRAEECYQDLINKSQTPQQARSVLPNSLKTEIVITGNLREWRHFFNLRTSSSAHPQMCEVAFMLLNDIVERIPVLFDEYIHENNI